MMDANNNTTDSSPENSSAESKQTPTAASEPVKQRIPMRDTTKEKRGKLIAIIGGVRAPRKD